mgnify:CR=1 FL=1
MKAIRIHEHGGREVLHLDTLPAPIAKDDEVIVQMKTAALNHLDLWVRKGLPGIPLPMIMGSDGAGIISQLGKLVKQDYDLKVNDEVIIAPIRCCGTCTRCLNSQENLCPDFSIPGEGSDGLQAEYVAVPARFIFKKPANLSWEEAAAFPLVSMTAYHMLVHKVTLKAGDWVLIYGASSGVGSAAIQMAKSFGATVITTAGSEEKADLARRLGADYVIDYRQQPIGKTVRELTNGLGVDVVFEHTGAQTWPDSLRALKVGGKIVTCGATTGAIVKIDLRALFIKHQQIIGSTMGTLQDLREIVQLIEEGKYTPVVDKVYPFAEIQEAHRRLEEGRQFGKVVLSFMQ